MPDSTLSEALKEAYASAPSDVILLHTLELRHPTFVDDHGNSTAIRVVRDHINHTCTLENSAPLNPGEAVEFIAMAFDLELPPVNNTPTPEISVTIDNVSTEMIAYLDRLSLFTITGSRKMRGGFLWHTKKSPSTAEHAAR